MSPTQALDAALAGLRLDPARTLLLTGESGPWVEALTARLPARAVDRSSEGSGLVAATEHHLAEASDREILAAGSAWEIAVLGLPALGRLADQGAPVRWLADPHLGRTTGTGPALTMVEDLGLVRGIPKLAVVVPADPPSVAAALEALRTYPGPVYVRLPDPAGRPVGGGPFELGKARELRRGTDLTIAAVGPPVALALDIAAALARIGIEARVLDLASVKPIDAKALVRSARETGAVLTLEEHSVLTGVGTAVAALLAEEAPVAVRRLGAPDLFGPGAGDWSAYGLSVEHGLEAAFELLRGQGKVQ